MALAAIHTLYAAPFLILCTTALLIWTLGLIPGFVGFLSLAAFVPAQSFVMKYVMAQRRTSSGFADSRMKRMNETIASIRVLKLSRLMNLASRTISEIRNKEIKLIQTYLMLRGSLAGVTQIVPSFALFACLLAWSSMNEGSLPNASLVFSAMSLLFGLRVPLILLPQAVTQAMDAKVAFKRIVDYLQSDSESSISQDPLCQDKAPSISLDFPQTLDSASSQPVTVLFIPAGSLVAITGPSSIGKTALLKRLMRAHPTSYRASLSTPWIHPSSIETNITLTSNSDPSLLATCLEATALISDIARFAQGVKSSLTDAATQLSGGQQTRLGLARAMYALAPCYILDDAFAGLDAAVALHVMRACLKEGMQGATRIVSVGTKDEGLLREFELVVAVDENGEILGMGTWKEMVARGFFAGDAATVESRSDVVEEKRGLLPSVAPEERVTVTNRTWMQYLELIGAASTLAQIIGFVMLTQLLRVMTDAWLSRLATNVLGIEISSTMGLMVYLALTLLQATSILLQGLSVSTSTCRASSKLHDNALNGVLTAPMKFFEENPVGRITARFGKDLDDVDNFLPEAMRISVFTASMVLTNLISIAILFPKFLGTLIPALYFYYFMQGYYRTTAKQIKRLESLTRTAITTHLVSTLHGSATLRHTRGAPAYFRETFYRLLADHNTPCFAFLHAQRWLSLRLECVSALLIGITAGSVALTGGSGSGVLLTYALQVTASLTWWVRQVSECERMMVGVERLGRYGALPLESESPIEEAVGETAVSFDDVRAEYANGTVALDGVSFHIGRGERVGLVGRTGAGKSSVVSLIAGILTASTGTVRVLPSAEVAIVSQNAVLLDNVTLRDNLDPCRRCSDDEIMDILGLLKLCEAVQGLGGLTATVTSKDLSRDSIQLVCIARAFLRMPNLLVLDEVEGQQIGELLSSVLCRPEYASMAVLMIGHQLPIVEAVCDYNIRISNGRIGK
ncbi:ABC transporter type 1, transmembrane domain-containing protein [Chytriomyces sp. MP71]|nr:ABC transporter type 1, transmembrane domain-containing protein [Chytriomyces sp. MP71]